ncbi:Uncharacterised protein [Yersinia mollaretii]|nr:Uncharacterised protein [Yersinia mollaretii]
MGSGVWRGDCPDGRSDGLCRYDPFGAFPRLSTILIAERTLLVLLSPLKDQFVFRRQFRIKLIAFQIKINQLLWFG